LYNPVLIIQLEYTSSLLMKYLYFVIFMKPSRIAPTHYGIDPMDGLEYLNEHLLQFKKWLDAVERLVDEGVTDVEEAARRLADYIEEARLAVESGNRIVYETFYKSTVWGLIEYFKEKKGLF
jgi:hypothetical protein